MTSASEKARKPLGRGLSSLLPPKPAAPAPAPAASGSSLTVAIESIEPNPVQPRTIFRQDRLEELADSIRANGIIQPLIVRRSGGGYQLIAGERRLLASKLVGLKEVPVLVKDVADPRMLELALIENIQREDLNPIETAHAYDRLARELHLSQDEIGSRCGKNRASVANTLRLLKLPQEIQVLVAENRLSEGSARAILSLPTKEEQIQMAEKAAAQGLSVRQVEAMVREAAEQETKADRGKSSGAKEDPNVAAAIDELTRVLQTRVRIIELTEQRGRIEIEYYSQEELDRLYRHLVGEGN